MSKSDFARHIGVSAGRVSQYLDSGILDGEALIGEGRSARINVEVATEQIRTRRHVGQSLGNGLLTRLSAAPTAAPPAAAAEEGDGDEPAPLTKVHDTAELIQLERLEQEKRKNRLAALDEAREQGQLVTGEDFRREIGKTAQTLVTTFMGMAPDIANAIAAQFHLPQRDVLFAVRQVMNEKRSQATTALRLAADEMPDTVTAEVEERA